MRGKAVLIMFSVVLASVFILFVSFVTGNDGSATNELQTRQAEAFSNALVAQNETNKARAKVDAIREEYSGKAILRIIDANNRVLIESTNTINRIAMEGVNKRETMLALFVMLVLLVAFISTMVICTNMDLAGEIIREMIEVRKIKVLTAKREK